jgi:hypothetical protein
MYLSTGGEKPARSVSLEIPEGDAGTAETIKWIRKFIYLGVRDPAVNRLAVAIVQSVPPYDQTAEAKAIYQWVRQNIRFTGDIFNTETVRTPQEILNVRAGDCDCINGVLIPTLLESVGIEARVVTVAADDSRPEMFSHIYPQANLDGRWTWVAMDAAAKSADFGKEPAHVYRERIWDLHSGGYRDLKGLGQDDDSGGFDLSSLTQLITAGTVGASNVIRAVNAPYAPSTLLPATSMPVTGVVPSSVAQTMYPAAAVTTSGSSVTVVIGGLALLLVALLVLKR